MGRFGLFFLGSEEKEIISIIAKRLNLSEDYVEVEFHKFIEDLKAKKEEE